jgi:hypothetical protein
MTPLLGKKIIEIAAGYSFTCAISDDGLLYGW